MTSLNSTVHFSNISYDYRFRNNLSYWARRRIISEYFARLLKSATDRLA